MPILVNDILELTDVQTLAGQTLLNIYHYRVDEIGVTTSYADIVNAWQGGPLAQLRAIQTSSLVHQEVIVRNLTNGLDLYTQADPLAGSVVGEFMPTFVAGSFRYVRATALTRHGYKRIGGLMESQILGNDLAAGMAAAMANVAAGLAEPISIDAGGDTDFVATPVIVGRYLQGEPDAGQYDLTKINDITGVTFVRITSQATRRAGRGA